MLFVEAGTVETFLASAPCVLTRGRSRCTTGAYRKLDVSGRRNLPPALAASNDASSKTARAAHASAARAGASLLGKVYTYHDRAGEHVVEPTAAVVHEYWQETGAEGNRGERDSHKS